MVRTCHSKKSAPSTTAADRRAITIVRTTCAGAKRTHTTPSSEGVGVVVGFVGSVCVILCSPVSPVPSLAGSVCGSLRSGVSPLFSLIPSPQLRTAVEIFTQQVPASRKVALLGLTVAADVRVTNDEVCCNWAYLLTKVQTTLKAPCCAFLRSVLTSITFHSGNLGDLVPLGI